MNRDLLIPRLQEDLPAVPGASRAHLFGSSEFLQDADLRDIVERNLQGRHVSVSDWMICAAFGNAQ